MDSEVKSLKVTLHSSNIAGQARLTISQTEEAERAVRVDEQALHLAS